MTTRATRTPAPRRRRHRLATTLVTLVLVAACQGENMDITAGYRPPEEVRRTGNRLRDEASLYLQQHARNPVDWYPWGEEALELARSEDRLIFLSSGYSSCHWCHVMEHEVFEHDDVAEALNRNFVCIKVDREENPAVDATYMQAVQLLTGGGGWPMSVFLTPDQKPFFGGTYIPHDNFLELLDRIQEVWTNQRAELERQAGQVTQRILAEPAADAPVAGAVDSTMLAGVVAAVGDRFDETHGGLAGDMKFPVPVRWQFLLNWHRRTGDAETLRMLEHTLDAMAGGGLRDHVGGGFHRYTVDPHWTVPHFEKMLYDNAQLATLYFTAGAALDRPDLIAVGEDVLEFLDREMCGDEGACYASFDADSGGEEGTYYVWTPAQITAAVGESDGPLLTDLLGVNLPGNFEHGASVVTRRTDVDSLAQRHGRDPDEAAALFDRHRDTLRTVRDDRTPPGLDRKIITAWNGLALSAFAQGYRATGRTEFRDRAVAIADFLERVHRVDDGGLARASNDGRAVGEGVLEDYALYARGLLELYQVTGRADHLDRARELLDLVAARFVRPAGAWYTTSDSGDTPLGRRTDFFDSVIPCGASAVVDALVTYGALTGHPEPLTEAADQLARQASLMQRTGLEMAGWLDAAVRLQGPLYDVVVAGDPGDPATEALYRAVAATLAPGVVISPLPAAGPDGRLASLAPVLTGKSAPEGGALAYVCLQGMCKAPTANPGEAGESIQDGWYR